MKGTIYTDLYIMTFLIVWCDSNVPYRISRNIDSDFNLVLWLTHRDCQINLRHYRSICTTSMGFSPCSAVLKQRCLSKPPNIMSANISA